MSWPPGIFGRLGSLTQRACRNSNWPSIDAFRFLRVASGPAVLAPTTASKGVWKSAVQDFRNRFILRQSRRRAAVFVQLESPLIPADLPLPGWARRAARVFVLLMSPPGFSLWQPRQLRE
jgi:hypothetical protein